MLTAATFTRCGVPADKARLHLPHAAAAMRERNITNPLEARTFLAQLMHESVALRYMEEIASGAAYEGRRDLGNTHAGDGRRYKGRGVIQLTGRANYRTYGGLLHLPLELHPEVAAQPRTAWRVAALFWVRAGCPALARRGDFVGVTRRINGGVNGLADRRRYFALLAGAGVVPGPDKHEQWLEASVKRWKKLHADAVKCEQRARKASDAAAAAKCHAERKRATAMVTRRRKQLKEA